MTQKQLIKTEIMRKLTPAERVENWNREFPRYPRTMYDKGWIYGVWYTGTAWQPVKLYGQYPQKFLDRALALFPDCERILHAPSGLVEGPGITLDSTQRAPGCPQIIGDVTNMPFDSGSMDLILTDPPYSTEDSKKYGCKPYPTKRALAEFHRVLEPGGFVGWLDLKYPGYRRKEWDLIGLIGVVTGAWRATRMFSILQKKQGEP